MSGKRTERKGVSIDHMGRRTWDTEYFLQHRGEIEREEAEGRGEGEEYDGDDGKVLAGAVVGGSRFVETEADSGFHCKACNLTFRSSVSWVDHLNSEKHKWNAGLSQRMEKSSVQDVREKLRMKTREMHLKAVARLSAGKAEKRAGEAKKEGDVERKKRKVDGAKAIEAFIAGKQDAESDLACLGLPTSFGKKK